MGLFIPNHRKPKRFSYEPRYYDPKKEESIRRRMRIKSKTRRRSPIGLFYLIALLLFALYIFNALG